MAPKQAGGLRRLYLAALALALGIGTLVAPVGAPPALAAGGAGSPDGVYGQNLGAGFTDAAGNRQPVLALGIQSDGGMIVGGEFTQVDGTTTNHLARLHPDGTLDTAFSANLGRGFDAGVSDLAVASDDSIIAVGAFNTADTHQTQVARVGPDGRVDSSYAVDLDGFAETGLAVGLQPDGSAIVGGDFAAASAGGRSGDSCRMLRLSPAGELDTQFGTNLGGNCNSPGGFDGLVEALAINPDGSIIAGGRFTAVSAHSTRLAKISASGVPDTSFFVALAGGSMDIYAVAVQSSGSIVFGGSFRGFESGNPAGGPTTCNIGRVAADSTADASFSANLGGGCPSGGGFDGTVNGVSALPDDRIAVTGQFAKVAGSPAGRIALLGTDGTPDSSYNSNTGTGFDSLGGFAVGAGPDGGLLIGGFFDTLSGFPAPGAGRLLGPAPTLQSVQPASGPTSGGTSVTITGTNLIGASAVTFGGGAAASFTVDSSTRITAVTPAGAAGPVDVQVTTGNGTAVLGGAYSFVAPPVPPSPSPSVPPSSDPPSSDDPVQSPIQPPTTPPTQSPRTKLIKQVPANKKGRPPKRIRRTGITVVTGKNALTNAGQRIRTRVVGRPIGTSAAGQVRYFKIIRGKKGKVSIRTYGYKRLKFTVVQRAPATTGYTAYRLRTVYRNGKPR